MPVRPWMLWVSLMCSIVLSERTAQADGLSARERRIAAYVTDHRDEAVAFLEKVVNTPSATQNLDGVRLVGRLFAAEFEKMGMAARWEEMPAAMNRAGHLIAEQTGSRGKRLLLIGHLDTVLEGERFRVEKHGGATHARGSGTVDMKGGDVIVLFALKALHDAGVLAERRLVVIFTGDEEDAGMPVDTSRASMRELARRSDAALAFEGAVDDTATVARRGVSGWSLEVKARTGHSSAILRESMGAGAIYEAARILDDFRQELAAIPDLTCNPSLILGGTEVDHDHLSSHGKAEGKTNVVPATAIVRGDMRFISEAQREEAEALMRAVAARSLPRTTARLTFQPEYPAMAPTPGNHALLRVLDQVSRDLGLGTVKPLDPSKRGAGDVSFVAPMIDSLDGLGAHGEGSHAADEWIDLDSFAAQIQKAAILIERLTRD